MRIAVMQPYIFPYIGYWQLVNAADRFVILDDVNYIMRGYINRNSILLDGKPYRFTIPIKKASQNKLIMETRLDFTSDKKQDLLKTIRGAYRKAPCYDMVMPVLEDIVNNPEQDLTAFARYSIEKVMVYLDMDTEILLSSEIQKKPGLKGEERIIGICKALGADAYINPCGGRGMYHREKFDGEGIGLYFLDTKMDKVRYNQGQEVFAGNLSVIDIMMFNDTDKIQDFLKRYELNG